MVPLKSSTERRLGTNTSTRVYALGNASACCRLLNRQTVLKCIEILFNDHILSLPASARHFCFRVSCRMHDTSPSFSEYKNGPVIFSCHMPCDSKHFFCNDFTLSTSLWVRIYEKETQNRGKGDTES